MPSSHHWRYWCKPPAPTSGIALVIPNEDLVTTRLPQERELISVAGITEEQQRLERHVELSELGVGSKEQIVLDTVGTSP